LRHASDIPAGTYYAAFTESGKPESQRLALLVLDQGTTGCTIVIRNSSGYTIIGWGLADSDIGAEYSNGAIPPGGSTTVEVEPGTYFATITSTGGPSGSIGTTYFLYDISISVGQTKTIVLTNTGLSLQQ
jgi:hypothetical protein